MGLAATAPMSSRPPIQRPRFRRRSSTPRTGAIPMGIGAHHAHHQYYGHNYSGHHGHSSAHETHGKAKKVAFNVISGHTKTR